MSDSEIPIDSSAGRYDYYYQRSRPAFVERILAQKHKAMLSVALGGRSSGTLVEVGPGEGFVGRAVRAMEGFSYLGIEGAPAGASLLRAQGFDIIEAMLPPFPESVPAADLIYASHLIEHLPGPDAVLRFLIEAKAQLADEGRLALVFPDARYGGSLFWDCDYTHQWPSTPHRVEQAAFDAGLRVVVTAYFCGPLQGIPAHALRTAMRLYPQRTLSALDRKRGDFWYRGRLLFVPDVLMVLSVRA